MAKNNMLLGYARGKVGDLVFQRRKGEQIVKARNRNPNNPRTWSQQMQRVRMYAPVAFYKMAIENFFRFAFEDKKPNETDYNAFIRENLNAFQGPYFTRAQVQQKYPVLAPYVISSGTLTAINNSQAKTENRISNSIIIQEREIGTEQRNVGYVSSQLIERYGLRNGDMLTFIIIEVKGLTTTENGETIYNGSTNFVYKNFVIDITSQEQLTQNSADITNQGFTISNPIEGRTTANLAFIDVSENNMQSAVGTAVIVTRRSNGKILASKTTLKLDTIAQNYYQNMSTTQQLIIAAQSYDAQDSALDPNSAKIMNATSSQINDIDGRTTKQTAMNCLPDNGRKTTDGVPPFTLNNECPTCECPIPEPEPCGHEKQEEIQQISKSRKRSSNNEES